MTSPDFSNPDLLAKIDHRAESISYSDVVRAGIKRRLLVLQLLGGFFIIAFLTFPVLTFFQELSKIISLPEERTVIIFTILLLLLTLYLFYTNLRNRIAISQGLGLIIVWLTVSTESNPFFSVVKLLVALFLFELPNIQKTYSRYLDYYSNYPAEQYNELDRLKALLDQHLQFLFLMGMAVLAVSWIVLAIFDQVSITLGGLQGTVMIPLIGLGAVVFYFMFSPRLMRTLRRMASSEDLPVSGREDGKR